MDITAPNLDIIFRTANLQYQSAFDTTESWYDKIATTIPMATRQVTFGFMDRVPVMRQWLGNRVVNAVTTHARTVTNEPFELTTALDKFDIADDQFGIFDYNVRSMGQQAKKWPDQRLANWLRSDASTVNSYDGVPQFSTSHPLLGGDVVGSSAGGFGGISGIPAIQSNLALSTALTYDNYITAFQAMMAFRGADGQPLNVVPDTLVVPPQLMGTAKQILESDLVPTTTGTGFATAPGQATMRNTWQGSAQLLVIPELADKSTNWWLLSTKNVVKPFVWHLRDAPVFTARTNPQDPVVFDTHQFVYGLEGRAAATESLWFLAYAGTSAASY